MVPFSPAECGRTAARIRRRQGRSDTRKVPPLEGRVASGVSRKPDDGRDDFRCASAPFGADCISVRHLFRRLRRHLPLKGKDWVELVPLLHPSKDTAFRYDTSSVACGDTFPSRGRTGWNSFCFCVRRNGLRVKIPPLEGRVASGVSRKPDDGRGDLRSVFAIVGTSCCSVRHLFRRLRRHLPLKGKDLGAELVPFLRPSKRTARKNPSP